MLIKTQISEKLRYKKKQFKNRTIKRRLEKTSEWLETKIEFTSLEIYFLLTPRVKHLSNCNVPAKTWLVS